MTIQELNEQANQGVEILTAIELAIQSAKGMAEFVATMTAPGKQITGALQQLPGSADAISTGFSPDFFAALVSAKTALLQLVPEPVGIPSEVPPVNI